VVAEYIVAVAATVVVGVVGVFVRTKVDVKVFVIIVFIIFFVLVVFVIIIILIIVVALVHVLHGCVRLKLATRRMRVKGRLRAGGR
jgi:hypothetical protein